MNGKIIKDFIIGWITPLISFSIFFYETIGKIKYLTNENNHLKVMINSLSQQDVSIKYPSPAKWEDFSKNRIIKIKQLDRNNIQLFDTVNTPASLKHDSILRLIINKPVYKKICDWFNGNLPDVILTNKGFYDSSDRHHYATTLLIKDASLDLGILDEKAIVGQLLIKTSYSRASEEFPNKKETTEGIYYIKRSLFEIKEDSLFVNYRENQGWHGNNEDLKITCYLKAKLSEDEISGTLLWGKDNVTKETYFRIKKTIGLRWPY